MQFGKLQLRTWSVLRDVIPSPFRLPACNPPQTVLYPGATPTETFLWTDPPPPPKGPQASTLTAGVESMDPNVDLYQLIPPSWLLLPDPHLTCHIYEFITSHPSDSF